MMEIIMKTVDWKNAVARPGQMLSEHSANVSDLASHFGSKCGLAELLRILGFLHDLGKTSCNFQDYLERIARGDRVSRGIVYHSIYGAKRAYEETNLFPYIAEIMANVIASHHGELFDNLTPDGETPLQNKLNTILLKEDSFQIPEGCPSINIDILKDEFMSIISKYSNEEGYFSISMLTKYAYSCLVDADRLDAYFSESDSVYTEQIPDWSTLIVRLEQRLSELEIKNVQDEIGELRKKISEDCRKSGFRDIGVYMLGAPTGGGKTLSSLRFALEHAKEHGLVRIIYVIPYLTILNQVAQDIRIALKVDDKFVLEHHSNFLPDDPKYYKLQIDRWDAPIILTSQVEFLESIFSARGSNLRKLHNMSHSVIIFDEAQSLPIKCVHLFNGAVNFLHRLCGSTILLCTATQPLLDKVERPILFSPNPSLTTYMKVPERYRIVNSLKPNGYTYFDLTSFVLEKHLVSTLVILNTKAAAKTLHETLKNAGAPVLHLSTNMCSEHRNQQLAELRQRLDKDNQEPVICVSTQLVEAGIDISFECVIRDIAGLDSIYQAAGRCNRHGEFGEVKNVYVINIPTENLDWLPDIKIGAEITMRLFNDQKDSMSNEGIDINDYYRYFFYERRNIMDYPIHNGGSIYDLLTVNSCGRMVYKSRKDKQGIKPPILLSAIRTAAREFCVIDKGSTEVIVPYGKGEELALEFSKADNLGEKRKLLRELGKYSVTLYPYQLEKLESRGALDDRNYGGLIFLRRGFYHLDCGIELLGNC